MFAATLVRKMGSSTSHTKASTITTPQRNLDYLYNNVQISRHLYGFDPSGYITYNAAFIQILYNKTVVVSCSSGMCVVLNAMLLFFLLTRKKFRNLKFFPLMLQALVDMIGPGITNIIHEAILYPQFKKEVTSKIDPDSNDFKEVFYYEYLSLIRLSGAWSCLITYLRLVLNEYTTGLCVLLGAFIRYALVCHPRRNILSSRVLRVLSVFLILYVSLALVANGLDMYFNFYPMETGSSSGAQKWHFHSKVEIFLNNCEAYVNRTNKRAVIDCIITLVIPASISCFFYVSIMVTLCNQKTHTSRNSTLSICFAASWLLWLLCWTPNYISLALMNETNSKKISYFEAYVILLRIPLQMLYSHVNPLIFIIILKPFMTFLLNLPKTLFMELHINDYPENTKYGILKEHACTIFRIVATSGFALSMFLLFLFVIFASHPWLGFEFNEGEHLGRRMYERFPVVNQKLFNMNFKALLNADADPRHLCGPYHGYNNYTYRRCFFVEEHTKIQRNFSEQVQACEEKGAFLFYARSLEEMNFVWDSIYKPLRFGDDPETLFVTGDWFLHMGFERKFRNSSISYLFTSVDGKMNISTETHSWFRSFGKKAVAYYDDKIFRGPSACFVETSGGTNGDRPYECMPGVKRPYSVCAMDFSRAFSSYKMPLT